MSTIVGIDDGECLVGTDRFLGERGSRDGSNEREAGQKAGRKDPGRIHPENHVDGFDSNGIGLLLIASVATLFGFHESQRMEIG